MKISIGAKIIDGPWGGGNLFFKNLQKYLSDKGHTVVFDLLSKDIDIILLTDPRFLSESSSFDYLDLKIYKKFINPKVKILHRINECDERKNTSGLNKFIIKASKLADVKVFVSQWLKNLYESQGININNNKVILSGSDETIFNSKTKEVWDGKKPIKIVTHHWGANWNKGFDIYQHLDRLLSDSKLSRQYSFTYIGNIPENFKFNNTNHIKPLSGDALSKELQKHDIYLTGTINEPSGNHHIEGALCGLPVLYIDSGGVSEYAKNFGLDYTIDDFQTKLENLVENYDIYSKKLNNYPFTSNRMCEEYEMLFKQIFENHMKTNNSSFLFFLFKIYLKIKNFIKKVVTNDW